MKGIDFDERFANWLRDEAGILERRRIARVGGGEILVSKFEEGFAARVHAAIAGLPELFKDTVVGEQYRDAARDLPGETRAACWREGVRRLLAGAVEAGRLTGEERAEVLAGIDSVAALLDSILWTGPLAAAEFLPVDGERDAYREARMRMDAANSLFTRFYGTFEGMPVVNHCPGAPFARRLLAQAWMVCTGTPPPE